MDVTEHFGASGGTGIALRNGYLYFATPTSVVRYKMAAGELKPTGAPEVVVADLPKQQEHADKDLRVRRQGRDLRERRRARRTRASRRIASRKSPGQDPCPLLEQHGGIWRFDENKLGQKQDDGKRYATGFRQMVALTWHDGSLYAAMNNRDQLDTLWPEQFTAQDNAEWPAELPDAGERRLELRLAVLLLRTTQKQARARPRSTAATARRPIAAPRSRRRPSRFPRTGRRSTCMFYTGTQFPATYHGGAFVAFHGSWNRAPLPQAGYNVTFQPFSARQGVGQVRSVRRRLRRQDVDDAPQRRRLAPRRRGAGAGRLALHRGEPEGTGLARDL